MDYDVAARLADGRAAVDDAQTYASAARPHTHDDLETWYGSERGLELQRLDADRVVLEAAARSAADALETARAQFAALARAWDGPGARTAADFLRRHCDSAAVVVEALTSAAQTCAELRDELWAAVDAKVTATTTVADRAGAHRGTWLPAAQSVLAGAPDEAAVAVVAEQVAPFVDTAIGDDWLRDMRTTTDAVRQAYRRAIDRLDAASGARFEVPGDLGPALAVQTPTPTPVVTVPQAAPAPAGVTPAGVPAAAPVADVAPVAAVPPVAEAAPLPGMPEGLPTGAAPPIPAPPIPTASLPGAALPNLGDALGGLFDSPAGTAPGEPLGGVPDLEPPDLEPPDLEPPALDEPDPPRLQDPEDLAEPEDDSEELDEPEEEAEEEPDTEPDGEPVEEPVELDEPEPAESDDPAAELVEDEPEQITPPPEPDCATAAPPPPPPEPTPCEMAADELPQVGE